ncbi:unnamed protein product [Rotaria sp. Silwood1]|nr:unnamed protein product [Rotaria sp. Silwood1]CAF3889852.1 unnamed protein product [Rotaria sp. Silwood1]CAF4646879.1 unnamed protein product [Rotaria sp. Silwood1]CAF5077300.1 unnamed protein product [Rotaria sp. Silwood1]
MTTTAPFSSNENEPSSSSVSFIQSQKGKPMLELNNCIFKLNKTTTSTKYWICTFDECLVKAHTNTNDKLIKMIGEHCHLQESEKIDIRAFREKVKQRVIDETTPIPRIYDEECAKTTLSTAAIAVLPSEREINSAFNKARRAVTPTTQLFDIPDPFSSTLRNDNFIVLDKMITRRQRIILFGTVEQLKMLFSSDVVLMDGTFSSCPVMFDQVYTLHSIKFEQCNLSIFFSFTYTYI